MTAPCIPYRPCVGVRLRRFSLGTMLLLCCCVVLARGDGSALGTANRMPPARTSTPLGASAAASRVSPFVVNVGRPARTRKLAGVVTGTIMPGGPAVTLTIANAGDTGELTFTGAAGQRIFAQFTNNTINANCCNQARAYIRQPNGSTLALGTQIDVSPYGGVYFYNNSVIDSVTLPTSGTYTLVLVPTATETGSATVTLYDVPADPITSVTPGPVSGTAANFTTTTPGQNLAVTFTGSGGQRIFAQFTNNTINPSCCNHARAYILQPNGSTLPLGTQIDVSPYGGVYFQNNSVIDTVTLPTSGTYTLIADPQRAQTGGVTVTLFDVPADPSVSATPLSGSGAATSFTTTTPGQNLALTFSGSSGQRIFVQFTNNTINPSCCNQSRAYIRKPDGSTLALGTQIDVSPYGGVYFQNNSVIDTVTLPTSGTYTLIADPQRTQTGSVTTTLYDVPPDPTGTLVEEIPANFVTTTPGQNISATFSGTAGEGIEVEFTANTINPSCCNSSKAWLLKPDGTKLALGTQDNGAGSDTVYFFDGSMIGSVTLPASGTYTLIADPDRAKTGGVTINLYDPPRAVTAYYLMDCDTASLNQHAYNIGYAFAQHHPGGTRLLLLDFGAAREVSSGVYGVKGFCFQNGSYVRFTNAEVLAALKSAADGVHNGYTTGSTLIAYGNSNYSMSAEGMSQNDAYLAGNYQQERAHDLRDYQVANGYNQQGRVIAGDYEIDYDSAVMTKKLVDGATDNGYVLDYNYGSADGCPFTFSGQNNQTCATPHYTWPLGDVGYVSYHGVAVPLPEIYYRSPDQAAQWTVVRRWMETFDAGLNFWGATGQKPAQITAGAGWGRLANRNPGLVMPELVCFGC